MSNYIDQSHDHMLNHPEHHHEHDDRLHIPGHARWAPCNDDQIPIFSQVGRGITGDSYVVRPKNEGNCEEFYLQGFHVDGATGEETLDWESRNISGGYLHNLNYTYRVRPWNNPPTFNMTFIYHKPPNCGWSWVSPNIPYCWDEKGPYPENMVGTGIATLFIRTDATDHPDDLGGKKGNPVDNKWIEKLVYPDGTTRENFNAPDPLEPWTSNLTFGLEHGDVLVPNLYDLSKILGFPATNIYNSVIGQPDQYKPDTNGDSWDNLKEYIDKQFEGLKKYVDNAINSLLNKIYYPGGAYSQKANAPAGGQLQPDGTILWPTQDKVAIGNMNLYGGNSRENWIKTDADGTNDVWAV